MQQKPPQLSHCLFLMNATMSTNMSTADKEEVMTKDTAAAAGDVADAKETTKVIAESVAKEIAEIEIDGGSSDKRKTAGSTSDEEAMADEGGIPQPNKRSRTEDAADNKKTTKTSRELRDPKLAADIESFGSMVKRVYVVMQDATTPAQSSLTSLGIPDVTSDPFESEVEGEHLPEPEVVSANDIEILKKKEEALELTLQQHFDGTKKKSTKTYIVWRRRIIMKEFVQVALFDYNEKASEATTEKVCEQVTTTLQKVQILAGEPSGKMKAVDNTTNAAGDSADKSAKTPRALRDPNFAAYIEDFGSMKLIDDAVAKIEAKLGYKIDDDGPPASDKPKRKLTREKVGELDELITTAFEEEKQRKIQVVADLKQYLAVERAKKAAAEARLEEAIKNNRPPEELRGISNWWLLD